MAATTTASIIPFRKSDTSVPAEQAKSVFVSFSLTAAAETASDAARQVQTVQSEAHSAQLQTIQRLPNGRTLVHPLYVSIEQSGDDWFAISNDLTLVGRGESDLDALDDLRSAIGELFETLLETRDELGPLMRDQLLFLEQLSGLDR